jgi:cell division transport system permease protein
MTHWLAQHAHAFALALGKLARSPVTSLLNVLVLGIALSLPLALYLGLKNVEALAGRFDGNPTLSVFMEVDASEAQVQRVQAMLEPNPAVKRVRWIPKDQAFSELTSRIGVSREAAALGHNPLPDAFVVQAASAESKTLQALGSEIADQPGVAHVELDSAWVRRLEALLNFGKTLVAGLAVLLSVALVTVSFNTIRLSILAQQEEIEVAGLIGATRAFIRRPFLYSGLFQGFCGGLAALGIVALLGHLLGGPLSEVLALYAASFRPSPIQVLDAIAVLGFSGLLGWVGAHLSASRHLRRAEPR